MKHDFLPRLFFERIAQVSPCHVGLPACAFFFFFANTLNSPLCRQLNENISKSQRRYTLMEQMKLIKKELGLEKDDKEQLLKKFEERIAALELPPHAEKVIKDEMVWGSNVRLQMPTLCPPKLNVRCLLSLCACPEQAWFAGGTECRI